MATQTVIEATMNNVNHPCPPKATMDDDTLVNHALVQTVDGKYTAIFGSPSEQNASLLKQGVDGTVDIKFWCCDQKWSIRCEPKHCGSRSTNKCHRDSSGSVSKLIHKLLNKQPLQLSQ